MPGPNSPLNQDAAERDVRRHVLTLLANRAVWGWAVIINRTLMTRICTTREDVGRAWMNEWEAAEAGERRARPVLAIRPDVGKPMIFVIAEDELSDLGSCPSLASAYLDARRIVDGEP